MWCVFSLGQADSIHKSILRTSISDGYIYKYSRQADYLHMYIYIRVVCVIPSVVLYSLPGRHQLSIFLPPIWPAPPIYIILNGSIFYCTDLSSCMEQVGTPPTYIIAAWAAWTAWNRQRQISLDWWLLCIHALIGLMHRCTRGLANEKEVGQWG